MTVTVEDVANYLYREARLLEDPSNEEGSANDAATLRAAAGIVLDLERDRFHAERASGRIRVLTPVERP